MEASPVPCPLSPKKVSPYTSPPFFSFVHPKFHEYFSFHDNSPLLKHESDNLALTPENIEKKKFKVCLEFHIGNCLGPCEGKQSVEEYDSQIKEIRELLKGNIASVIRDLKDRMKDHAAKFEFEQSQFLKEKIDLLDN